MKCVLISFFDSGNLGDLLIAASLADTLEQYMPTVRLSYSAHPGRMTDVNDLTKAFSPVHVRVWPGLIRRWAHAAGLEGLVRGMRRQCVSFPWSDDPDVVRVLSDADLVVIGGGNMIFDTAPWTRSWEYFDAAVDAARLHGAPVLAMCLGIGPFASADQARQASQALSKCERISFRDQASLDLYKNYSRLNNAVLSVDPVFGIEARVRPASREGAIGINCVDPRLMGLGPVRVWRHRRDYVRLITEVLRRFPNDVVLFSTDMNDYPLLRELERRVGSSRCRVRNVTGQQDLFELYQDTPVVVAARMHVLITAYTQRIPVVGLSWQTKVEGFFGIIGDEASVFALDDAGRRRVDVVNCLASKLSSLGTEREKIALRVPAVRRHLLVNHEMVRSVLEARDA